MSSGSRYDVVVKLSALGGDQVSSNLKSVTGAAQAMATQLSSGEAGIRKLSATFRGTTETGEKFSVTMRQLAESHNMGARAAHGHAAATHAMSGSLLSMAGSMATGMAMMSVLTGIVNAIGGFISKGAELNALLETSQLGIMATILTYRQYRDEQGNVVKGQEAMNLAFAEGGRVQRLLQSEAFNTTATLKQMLEGYQRLQMGASSQKATTEQITTLVATLGNVATATGKDFQELSDQTARVMMGVIRIQSPMVAILRSMGISNDTIRSWIDQGVAVRKIQEALVQFLKIGPEINKTWTGVKSNVEDVVQQMSGAAFAPIMESIKGIGLGFVSALTTTYEENGRKITRLSDEAKTHARQIGEVLRIAFEIGTTAAGQLFSTFGTFSTSSFGEWLRDLAISFARFKAIVSEVVDFLVLVRDHSLIALHGAIGMQAVMSGDVAGAKAQVEWIQELIRKDVEYTAGVKARSASRAATLIEDIFRINAAMSRGPGDQGFVGPMQPSGNGNPNPRPPDPKIQAAIDKYKEFMELLKARLDTSGLTGLDLALSKNVQGWVKEEIAISRALAEVEKAAPKFKAQAEAMAGKAQQDNNRAFIAGTEKSLLEAREKEQAHLIKRTADYQNAMDRMTSMEKASLEDRIEAQVTAAERQARIEHQKAVSAAASLGEILDADEKYARALASIEETVAANEKIIRLGRQGEYEKMYARIVKAAMDAGATEAEANKKGREQRFAAEMNNAKTLAEAHAAYAKAEQLSDAEILAKRAAANQQFKNEIKAANQAAATDTLSQALSGNLTGESFKATMKQLTDTSVASFSKLLSTYLEDVKIAGASLNTWIGIAMQLGSALAGSWGSHQQSFKVGGQTFTQDFGGDTFGKQMSPYIGAAVAAAVIPVYGWIAALVILVIGAISSLINGPKEGEVSLMTKAMGNNSPIGQAMQQVYGATYGSLADVNRRGGGSALDLNKYMNANMESIRSWQIKLHAGSGEDLGKDAENFFKVVLPRIFIQQAFGQTWTGRFKNSITDAGYAGTEGAPLMAPGSFDPNAPIPKMLKGLGLTAEMIRGVALQIDLRDPDKFLEWLGRVVNVISGFKTTVANMGKSWQQIELDMLEGQRAGATTAFKTSTQTLVDLAGEIGNYVGDEQLARMEALQKASDEYYATALKAIQGLITLMRQIDSEAAAFASSAQQYYKNADWLASDRGNRMSGLYGPELAAATTTATVQDVWNRFMADAQAQLNYLIGLINQANAGLKASNELAAKFNTIMADAARETTVFTLWDDVLGLQRQLAAAQKLSGQAQIDALSAVNASATTLYASLLQIIQGINSAEASVHKSIQQQIWENNFGIAGNDAARLGMINQQIGGLMSGLGSQATAGGVTQSASEIQAMISRYLGMFKEGDPNRAAAVKEANALLAALDKATKIRLEQLRKQAQADADAAEAIVKQTAGAFKSAQESATAALNALVLSVGAFREAVDTKLLGWVNEITDELGIASAALIAAMLGFEEALAGPKAGTAGGGPRKYPIVDDLETAGASAVAFSGNVNTASDAILRFSKRLDDAAVPGATAPPPSSSGGSTESTITTLKRYPQLLMSRTGQ